jgi:hypothetical protein
VAPHESEAYEQDWYRTMKALAERRDPPARERTSRDGPQDVPLDGVDDVGPGMAQLAAIEAVEALGDIGGASAVAALIECLDDPDAPVRMRVIQMLGDLGDRRAVPSLRELAGRDPDPGVVNAAKETLTRLDPP